jgi:predicted DNA-binding transcriptional regulator YafY
LPTDRMTNGPLLTVVVRLNQFALRTLEDHPDFAKDIVEDASGGWLRFETPRSELEYFARELFALGPDATVLEPDELRDRIVALAESTVCQYADAIGDGTVSPKQA